MVTGRMGHISVFCSYAHEDEPFREELQRRLAPLRSQKIIDDWYDNRIQAGMRWNAQIQSALEGARLVLFIVSPDLLASRYIREVELPRSLERERNGQCHIVPIVAREANWGDSPLAEFQALPQDALPIESAADVDLAYAGIVEALADVCKRIVDWENPYKRAQVGDWTHHQQTMTLPDGRSVSTEIITEVVKKTSTHAVARAQGVAGSESLDQTLTIDLTRPLEDRMGDLMSQLGEQIPPDAEIRIGPKHYEEEFLVIGGVRYETIKASRHLSFSQRDWEASGEGSTWLCIDVPLDGVVKAVFELPGVMRQNQVLLGYGNAGQNRRKPKLSPKVAPPPLFGPGRWAIQMNVFGASTGFDLLLQPNGALQGTQQLMGMTAQLQGQWGFDGSTKTLTLQLVAMMMGFPAAQDVIQVRITGRDGALLRGSDILGREFVLRRRA